MLFLVSRGIRQGCPLSPLLFILIIEILSVLIQNAQQRGVITGVKVTSSLYLTHLLFVDDVILFGEETIVEWQHYKQILDMFCSLTAMQFSGDKSSFLFNVIYDITKENIAAILPYKMEPLLVGFKYLGFYLKPLGYQVNDWHWLIKKFEQRISNWTYRLLSLGSILILIQSVLMGLSAY